MQTVIHCLLSGELLCPYQADCRDLKVVYVAAVMTSKHFLLFPVCCFTSPQSLSLAVYLLPPVFM